MTLKQLVKMYGNSNRFELATGISHVNWLNWHKRGYIPIQSQRKIEKITKGQLKADLNDLPDWGI